MSTQQEWSRTDDLFTALSTQPRRRVLTALVTTPPQDEGEFAPIDFVDDDENPNEAILTLHHNHLPYLNDAGFIDWNRDAGTIRRGAQTETIEPIIELLVAHHDELPADWV